MNLKRSFLSLCLLIMITGVAMAQKVQVQVKPGADWSSYKNYGWGAAATHPSQNPMTDQLIREQINQQLQAKGLTLNAEPNPANPDLFVVYHVATSDSLEWNTFGGFRGFGMQQGTVNKIVHGQLMVELMDPHAKIVLWQGIASDTVSDNVNKNNENITKAITKMFSNFPNPPK